MSTIQGIPLEYYILSDGSIAKEFRSELSYVTSIGVVESTYSINFRNTSGYVDNIIFAQVWNNGSSPTITITLDFAATTPFILQVYFKSKP